MMKISDKKRLLSLLKEYKVDLFSKIITEDFNTAKEDKLTLKHLLKQYKLIAGAYYKNIRLPYIEDDVSFYTQRDQHSAFPIFGCTIPRGTYNNTKQAKKLVKLINQFMNNIIGKKYKKYLKFSNGARLFASNIKYNTSFIGYNYEKPTYQQFLTNINYDSNLQIFNDLIEYIQDNWQI